MAKSQNTTHDYNLRSHNKSSSSSHIIRYNCCGQIFPSNTDHYEDNELICCSNCFGEYHRVCLVRDYGYGLGEITAILPGSKWLCPECNVTESKKPIKRRKKHYSHREQIEKEGTTDDSNDDSDYIDTEDSDLYSTDSTNKKNKNKEEARRRYTERIRKKNKRSKTIREPHSHIFSSDDSETPTTTTKKKKEKEE